VCSDDIVIYTGRNITEAVVENYLAELSKYDNVYVKFGRYIPSLPSIIDSLTSVKLASNNQFFVKM